MPSKKNIVAHYDKSAGKLKTKKITRCAKMNSTSLQNKKVTYEISEKVSLTFMQMNMGTKTKQNENDIRC